MLERDNQPTIIGRGAYTPAEAAQLVRVPVGRIHRWLEGRSRRYKGEAVFDPPLWTAEFPQIEGHLLLSFRDLIELRVVDRFRQNRLSLPYLRKVVEAARSMLGDTHPFSNVRVKSDGRRLYAEILSATGEPALIDLLSGQHAFHSIISVGLKDIVFDNEAASYWAPEEGKGEVVIDPRRSFGKPVLLHSGIPTRALKLQADAGRSPRDISRDFEVDERSVRAALAFEMALAA
jgi:uncharacterized protein (DUF433 family)